MAKTNQSQARAKKELLRVLGCKTIHAEAALEVMCENLQLLDRKQRDYGPHNIADFGTLGVIVRLNDKVRRLQHLFTTQSRRQAKPQNETVLDTLKDISNYAVIGELIQTKSWPLFDGGIVYPEQGPEQGDPLTSSEEAGKSDQTTSH